MVVVSQKFERPVRIRLKRVHPLISDCHKNKCIVVKRMKTAPNTLVTVQATNSLGVQKLIKIKRSKLGTQARRQSKV